MCCRPSCTTFQGILVVSLINAHHYSLVAVKYFVHCTLADVLLCRLCNCNMTLLSCYGSLSFNSMTSFQYQILLSLTYLYWVSVRQLRVTCLRTSYLLRLVRSTLSSYIDIRRQMCFSVLHQSALKRMVMVD